jgi:hypothetical protein
MELTALTLTTMSRSYCHRKGHSIMIGRYDGKWEVKLHTYIIYMSFITIFSDCLPYQWTDFLVQVDGCSQKASVRFVDFDELICLHVHLKLDHSIRILRPVIFCPIGAGSELPSLCWCGY